MSGAVQGSAVGAEPRQRHAPQRRGAAAGPNERLTAWAQELRDEEQGGEGQEGDGQGGEGRGAAQRKVARRAGAAPPEGITSHAVRVCSAPLAGHARIPSPSSVFASSSRQL